MNITTTRYLMTDTAAGTAYIQDWTPCGPDSDDNDVVEGADLLMPALDVDDFGDVDAFHAAFESAAIKAAEDAGFVVVSHAGDNADLGDCFRVATA